ncbi:MAG: transposase, partial [Phototrophicaceae bacterium]
MSRIITLDVGGYLIQAVEAAANTLMEAEAAALVKASYYERNGQRATYRNGYRLRQWQTPAEAVTLYIPKLRSGSYYPAFLSEPAAALRFVALAESALIRTPTIAEVMDLLTFPNTETARH